MIRICQGTILWASCEQKIATLLVEDWGPDGHCTPRLPSRELTLGLLRAFKQSHSV